MPSFLLHPHAFLGTCSAFEQSAGKLLSPAFGKVQGNQEQSAARAALASDRTCMLLTPCFFLSSLSFSRFYLCRFDEPTQAEVTMTESHTLVPTGPWAASISMDRIPRVGRQHSSGLDLAGGEELSSACEPCLKMVCSFSRSSQGIRLLHSRRRFLWMAHLLVYL